MTMGKRRWVLGLGLLATTAVGAVDYLGKRADFSSFGPTPDGRIKPDLVAPGEQVVTAGNVGIDLGLSSGTSVASPMLVGALASLWSAYPHKTAAEILAVVFASADQARQPDNERGYGLPDLTEAWLRLGGFVNGHYTYAFDRDRGALTVLSTNSDLTGDVSVEMQNLLGQSVGSFPATFNRNTISTLTISGLAQLPAGAYQVILQDGQRSERMLVMLWK